jgi:hypothetical protein
LEKYRSGGEYDVDGLVVRSNSTYTIAKGANPKYAIAFKHLLKAEMAETRASVPRRRNRYPLLDIAPPYNAQNRPVWASNTYRKGSAPHRLVMQNDGNLVIYDSRHRPTWSSRTANRR